MPPGVSGNYPDLEDVSLPDPTTLSDKLQAKYTLRLLKGVAPGVHLRIMGNQLCGMRKGVCHVWWSQSEIPGDGILHGNLLKEQFVPIFNMQVFISGMLRWFLTQLLRMLVQMYVNSTYAKITTKQGFIELLLLNESLLCTH